MSYGYDSRGYLAALTTPSGAYAFTYDGFGNARTVKAGNYTLAEHTYAAGNGNLTSTRYGNGFTNDLQAVPLIVYANGSDSKLPNQGPVSEVPDAPSVDAGKQGKHVPGHPNNDKTKTQWEQGETGVRETQEAWRNGRVIKPDGSVRVGTASDGRQVKVHQDKKGWIHGYPVHLEL